jgi:hypothetical protein
MTQADLILKRRWPFITVLPVVQRGGAGFPPAGILLASEIQSFQEKGSPFHVYHKNLYALESGPLASQIEGVPRDAYNSIEEMAAAGWEVD